MVLYNSLQVEFGFFSYYLHDQTGLDEKEMISQMISETHP